jgi:flagellar motor protein MotB
LAEESAKKNPIIIKKVNKGAHGHHGGAWKIAYADFVTAMMAFFLLLWLLNSVTQEQLEGISNYFAPVTASQSTSGSGDILGGQTITEEGAAQNTTSRDSVTVDLPPPKAGTGGEANTDTQAGSTPDEEAAAQVLKQREQDQFEEAKEQLEATINSIPQLKSMKDSLLIDNTPEGLRIQLVDKDGLSMFQRIIRRPMRRKRPRSRKRCPASTRSVISRPPNRATPRRPRRRDNLSSRSLAADRCRAWVLNWIRTSPVKRGYSVTAGVLHGTPYMP